MGQKASRSARKGEAYAGGTDKGIEILEKLKSDLVRVKFRLKEFDLQLRLTFTTEAEKHPVALRFTLLALSQSQQLIHYIKKKQWLHWLREALEAEAPSLVRAGGKRWNQRNVLKIYEPITTKDMIIELTSSILKIHEDFSERCRRYYDAEYAASTIRPEQTSCEDVASVAKHLKNSCEVLQAFHTEYWQETEETTSRMNAAGIQAFFENNQLKHSQLNMLEMKARTITDLKKWTITEELSNYFRRCQQQVNGITGDRSRNIIFTRKSSETLS